MSPRVGWTAAVLAAGGAALAYWWPAPQSEVNGAAASQRGETSGTVGSDLGGGDEAAREPVEWPSRGPCGHRYVPSRPGEWRRYELVVGEKDPIAMTLRVASAERSEGEWDVQWELRLRGERYRLNRRCNLKAGAEDPWYGYMPVGTELAQAPSTWRFPATLEAEVRFSGSSELQMPRDVMHPDGGQIAIEVTRAYRVTGTDVVETPAGPFEAWRLPFEERRFVDGEPSEVEGTLWLAAGAGLVRAVTRESSMRKEWRLVDLGYDEDAG